MLFKLFYTFAKIGLFTFGGGYGMIAIVQDECVENKKWITEDEFATVLTIAESTPGPIAINCATYTGYAQGGTYSVSVNLQDVEVDKSVIAAKIDSLLTEIDFSISGYNKNSG